MNFVEGIHNEQYGEKGFASGSGKRNKCSEQQKLRDLEEWRDTLLQKCEANERDGKNCDVLRQVIADEYDERELELRQRAHYVEHSA